MGASKSKPRTVERNPSLERLRVLVGDWDMELSGASFLPDGNSKVHGPASISWIEGGAFLVMYQGKNEAPNATWLFGSDGPTDRFKVLYFDARKVSRIYGMSFRNGVWKMWRNAPDLSQRYRGVLSRDDDTITGEWKRSDDGKKWVHDFYVKYTRNGPTPEPGSQE